MCEIIFAQKYPTDIERLLYCDFTMQKEKEDGGVLHRLDMQIRSQKMEENLLPQKNLRPAS